MAEMNEQAVAELVRQVLLGMAKAPAPAAAPAACEGKLTAADYPLGSKRPEILKSPRGKAYKDLTLDAVMKGEAVFEDFKITPDVLEMQAQVAESAGRPQIARNLRRAAELNKVPDERVLQMYNALRPHRSTFDELNGIADELENQYGAKVTAGFVREAADVYRRRKLLKGDLPEA
jgi:propanediol dehydratase small subunit